jgi:hypothetical protein
MLNLTTINGFDLLLLLVIISLVIRVRMLNNECDKYVGQIIKVSWELQEIKDIYRLEPHTYDADCVGCYNDLH